MRVMGDTERGEVVMGWKMGLWGEGGMAEVRILNRIMSVGINSIE